MDHSSGLVFRRPQATLTADLWSIFAPPFSLSVIISVAASILAIWEYTETEVLWRTVATCVVIGAGTGAFTVINRWFGQRD